MMSEIKCPLSTAYILDTPAVETGVTVSQYLGVLRDAPPHLMESEGHKPVTWVNTFERWLGFRKLPPSGPLPMSEALLAAMRRSMDEGEFLTIRRRVYGGTYGTGIVNGLRRLHNSLYPHQTEIIRELVDFRHYDRLRRFLSLSEPTQMALKWYEISGTKASGDGLQTVATRKNAISEALTVLDRLNLPGLEQVTEEHVVTYLGTPDETDREYRRRARSLHNLSSLTRSCHSQGMLPQNPFSGVGNRTFSRHATKDFVLPEGLQRLQDLDTLERSNREQVRDRLICLLFADLAVRSRELESIDLVQVRRSGSSFEFLLFPDEQKMGKPHAVLPLFYDQTHELLEQYLTAREAQESRTESLFVNTRGARLRSWSYVDAVKRECERLEINCYFKKDKLPTPHVLRRTFGMCNIDPLGLRLGIHDIAFRLRDSMEVVEEHYVRDNPLLTGRKAEQYRRRSAQGVSVAEARRHVEALQGFGISTATLDVLRDEIGDVEARSLAPEATDTTPAYWVDKDAALSDLRSAWCALPSRRVFHEFMKANSLTKRSGPKGKSVYDGNWCERMVKEYIPLSQVLPSTCRPSSRQIKKTLKLAGDVVKIGRFVVIRKEDVHLFLKDR